MLQHVRENGSGAADRFLVVIPLARATISRPCRGRPERGMVPILKILGLTAVVSTAMLSRASFAANPTLATSISSFEGTEEPTVLYHPSNATFTNDSYVNMTNQTGGIVRFTLRYNPASDRWDGDRSTTNDDRQRAEVK